jgi:hypothetical protein
VIPFSHGKNSGNSQPDPRVNIQNAQGMSKAYQVKQVLQAVDRLEVQGGKKY